MGDINTRVGVDLLTQRYQSLQQQVPLLYLGLLACFVGLHMATSGELAHLASPVTLVIVVVMCRLAHWVRSQRRVLSPERMHQELRRTLIIAFLLSTFFCSWAFYLFARPHTDRHFVLLFGSLASIGTAYALSSFPKAARIPLFLLGAPLAGRSVLTGEPGYVGSGIALALIVYLVSRVLTVHSNSLEELIESRGQTELERERAQEAEREARREREKADQLAGTDYLTGLANRRAFMNAFDAQLRVRSRHSVSALAVIDLDGFKPINDAFGHATGDAVLQVVARRLAEAIGATGLCARIGGDEFVVLIPQCSCEAAAQAVGARLCSTIEEPVFVGNREFRISGCCGVAIIGQDVREASVALLRADTALYEAKDRGKASVSVFSVRMDNQRRRRVEIESALRDPAVSTRIGLVYQPIFDLKLKKIIAFEALARWQDKELGEVSPSEFIPIAEQIGTIEDISDELLRKAIAEAVKWPEYVALSYNLSTVQLCSRTLATRILCEMHKQGLSPSRLQIEVTETVLLVDFDTARGNLTKLRAEGVRVSLDDFGAGYASISYLQEMQFDCVKLDGSLIKRATTGLSSKRLLKGVIDLCSSLVVPCVAEQVETQEQLDLLLEMHCARAQGYFLSEPLTAGSARHLVSNQRLGYFPLRNQDAA